MNNNIYQKLHQIQVQTGQLVRGEINKFQNYKYFTEYNALTILKPLLAKQQLVLSFDDDGETIHCEKMEKEWVVQYRKRMILTNSENPSEQLTYHFWATGQNTDIAKAKGSAETYAVKYFLQKLFLIPTSDNLDPDQGKPQVLSEQEMHSTPVGQKKQVAEVLGKHKFKDLHSPYGK